LKTGSPTHWICPIPLTCLFGQHNVFRNLSHHLKITRPCLKFRVPWNTDTTDHSGLIFLPGNDMLSSGFPCRWSSRFATVSATPHYFLHVSLLSSFNPGEIHGHS
jgi:hypothetical protein